MDDQTQEVEQMPLKNRIFVYLMTIFFAVFVGTGVYLVVSGQAGKDSAKSDSETSTGEPLVRVENMIIPTVEPTYGSMVLRALSQTVAVGSDTQVELDFNSGGENVSGFDALIKYDKNAFDFVNAISLKTGFGIYNHENGEGLTVTVVRTATGTESAVLEGPVVRMTFKAKSQGTQTIEFLESLGQETTKFVNDQTQVKRPEMTGITVEVN